MSYTDQILNCRDCNQEFTFTAGEQEFFASRGLTNAPSRCPSCRSARKQQGGGQGRGGYSRGGNGGYRSEPRQMYTAICASCGNEAQVPFQPREDRPVYCSDCFQNQRDSHSGGRGARW
ncbi:zinc-ribbon domain containing protein [Dictyobacter halimunensis]|uniref:zinc-ribbon domain containing protein n=1 Tax=Dictyobacter halimunensis TaxID=3026934 RepID=UPI0030C76277